MSAARRLRADPGVREAWRVFLGSRLLVAWVAALAPVMLAISPEAHRDVPQLTHPFGSWPLGGVFDFFLSPLAHWDALWYLQIAQHGYMPTTLSTTAGSTVAFFPGYPSVVHVVAGFGGAAATLAAAALVSLAAFLAALVVLRRLVKLELGERFGRPVLLLVAFYPVSFFFSAPYTESLFLLLSVGAFYAARTGRWAVAGVLAAVASGTRNSGVLLILPLLILYLYGPRPDGHRRVLAAARGRLGALRPRYSLRPDVLWLVLAPLGLVLFGIELQHVAHDPLAWSNSQGAFDRDQLTWPTEAVRQGIVAAYHGVEHLGSGGPAAWTNLLNFAFLLFAVVATVGVFRALPFAYGAYTTVALLLPLTAPVPFEPMRAVPRYSAVLFPLFMWAGAAAERRGLTQTTVRACAAGLALLTAVFATWQPLL